jgi:NADH-quinone oxidoreductase subunit E
MLSDDEKREIDEERAHYPDAQAVVIEALKVVQRHRRWVSDETLRDVAAYLGLSAEAVDNVATFYNLIFRRPVGRHVILVCDSVSCWVMGCEEVYARLKERLGASFGGTSNDGSFTLLPVPCLGACDHAPVLMVDEELHQNVAPDDIDGLLERYREGSEG